MKTILISGITRSGLTLTMQMLNAGGYPCFGEYPAFEGYELGKIPFNECSGMAIKAIDTHLQMPPPGDYHVIRLRRNYKQQAKSMVKFLNEVANIPQTREFVKEIEKSLPKDYIKIDRWAQKQAGLLILDFEELILHPLVAAKKLHDFVGHPLNIKKMVACVKTRDTNCYPTMIEYEFI